MTVPLAVGCGTQLPAPTAILGPGSGPKSAPASPTQQARTQQGIVAGTVVVGKGDTLFSISRRYRTTVRDLIDTNRLKAPYTLAVGQRLILPLGRTHLVARGETLYGISRAHGVDMRELARTNGLRAPYVLKIGTRLALPTRTAAVSKKRPPTQTAVAVPPPQAAVSKPLPKPAASRAVAKVIPRPPGRAADKFLWPVRGKVITRYGPKDGGLHNDGINISAPRGATVRAAENGVVAYAGNELRGYGKLLLIRHAGGWVTAYAHNDSLLVRRGDTVRRGQAIGEVGSTGNVAKPQTHFEIRRGDRVLDPLKYLSET